MSAGTSVGRRNSGRSGPVASDQAKSSAYKGVSWHKHSQKWYAYIQSGGKMRGLGYFDSQADAAKAYDAEARKVHFPALHETSLVSCVCACRQQSVWRFPARPDILCSCGRVLLQVLCLIGC